MNVSPLASVMPSVLKQFRTRQCPFCGSRMVRTSEFSPYLDRFSTRIWLALSLRRPFRCLECDERFYDLRFKRRTQKSAA